MKKPAPFRLAKSDYNGQHSVYSENWISNGHWAIRRSAIEGALNLSAGALAEGRYVDFFRLGLNAGALSDGAIERGLYRATGAEKVPWTVTSVSQIDSTHARQRFLECSVGGPLAAINEHYMKALGLDTGSILYGKPGGLSAFSDGADLAGSTAVIMPMSFKLPALFAERPEIAQDYTDKLATFGGQALRALCLP
jgi:hypothetical protein